MPSRAEIRGRFEMMLRFLSVSIIVYLLWQSLDHGRVESVVGGRTATLPKDLREWTQRGIAPDRIAVQLDSVPTPRQRDWLAALSASGTSVSWNGSLPAVGVEVQPVLAPSGGYNVLVSAPAGSQVVLSDEIGAIDTLRAGTGGARISVESASGIISVKSGGTAAQAILPETPPIRRVLVIGDANWESKFVVAALEEENWKVDAQTHVSPGVSVTQGSINPIDTSRYSAVVALDRSASAYGSEIVRYAATGGGVVIGAEAAGIESLSQLRAGAAGRIDAPSAAATEPGSVTLQSLSVLPVSAIKADAIPLDRRGGSIAVAARRFNAGRVVQIGYLDTWRWRMSGAEGSVADHRKWWTNVVAGVAYAPSADRSAKPAVDDAPLARLVESLGSPSAASGVPLTSPGPVVPLWMMFALLSGSLLAEWVSRRTRGMR